MAKRSKSLRGLPSEHASAAARSGLQAHKLLEESKRQLRAGECASAYVNLVRGTEALAKAEVHASGSQGRETIPRSWQNLAADIFTDFSHACIRHPAKKKQGLLDRLRGKR